MQEKDDIDKVVIPDLDDLMKEQDENGNPVDSEDVVDKFMDEKFFGEDDEDEDDEDARMDKEAEEKEAAEAAAKDKEL